jgi:FixJ family two-component response regulator
MPVTRHRAAGAHSAQIWAFFMTAQDTATYRVKNGNACVDLAQQPSERSPIVFVVDDDADVRDGLKALIESVGLTAIALSSTGEFLGHQLPDEPSCLILDVRLPGLSGLDFQTELTEKQIGIPIIFITGHGDIPMTVKAMKAGAVDFLTKPVREQDILDAVRVAIGRDSARRADERRLHDLRVRYDTLSPREKKIMTLVTAGMLNKQAAAEIGISEITVKVHRHNVMRKLEARSLAALVRIADMFEISRAGPTQAM